MNDFIQLLITYWKPIVGILFTIAGFVIAIVKKRPVNDILSDIYHYCAMAVKMVEVQSMQDETFKGAEKLKVASSIVSNFLCDKYPTLDIKKYVDMIENTIEEFLSTPQKKG